MTREDLRKKFDKLERDKCTSKITCETFSSIREDACLLSYLLWLEDFVINKDCKLEEDMAWKERDKNPEVELNVTFLYETKEAIKVNDGDKDIWIPKSLCHYKDKDILIAGESMEVFVEEWFANKEGLI